ncbi:MAG: UpxY family transcription antiterminator [Nitrospirae bacterium]|nr:UpxY family transcription antiterminator [Nitrospirota bacterium]
MESTAISNIYWYAIHVKSRHEYKVLERLTKIGIEAFLLTTERMQRWKDRKKIVSFPIFPGYLFVHIHKVNQEMLIVLKTQGVVKFIGMVPGEPESVPEEQIIALKRLVESKESLDPYPYLKKGQRVRIKKGPLVGMEGIFVERAGQHIFVISVDILRQGLSLKIDAADVESV